MQTKLLPVTKSVIIRGKMQSACQDVVQWWELWREVSEEQWIIP